MDLQAHITTYLPGATVSLRKPITPADCRQLDWLDRETGMDWTIHWRLIADRVVVDFAEFDGAIHKALAFGRWPNSILHSFEDAVECHLLDAVSAHTKPVYDSEGGDRS